MRIFFLFFLVAFCLFNSCSQKNRKIDNSNITAKVDERTELVSIVFRLADCKEFNFNLIKSYSNDIDEYFQYNASHPVVLYAYKLRAENQIGYDAVMALGIRLNIDGDKISLLDDISDLTSFDERWNENNIKQFIELLNDFYKVTKFHEFFLNHAKLYEKAEINLNKVLKKVNFNWFEKYYGEKMNGRFVTIISLINNGGYGINIKYKNSQVDFYSILGPDITDSTGIPKYKDSMEDFFVHEINHSFCKRLTEENYPLMKDKAAEFYSYVENKMRSSYHGSPKSMIDEMINNALVIKYLQANKKDSGVVRKTIFHFKGNGFFWIDKLVLLLDDYEKNRTKYPTLSSFMPEIVKLQNSLSPSELFEEYNMKCPSIVFSSIANNDNNVDPELGELIITFDQKMDTTKSGVYIGSKGYRAMPETGDGRWDIKTQKQCTIPLRLKPNTEYSLSLPSAYFINKEGYHLKDYYYMDFQTKK